MGKKKTNEEWLKICKSIHGDSVDYSQTDFNKRDEKGRVKFICPIHGKFKQNLMNHVHLKQDCPKCKGGVKLSNEEFIKRSKEIYGENTWIYDYVDYVNENTEVILVCPIHGKFTVKPSQHLNKNLLVACPYCKNRINIEKVFKELKEKYDDDLHTVVSYYMDKEKNFKYYININCKIHGDFTIRLDHLLERKGGICKKCDMFFKTKTRKLANEAIKLETSNITMNDRYTFIWKAIQKYGYYANDYREVNYIDTNSHVYVYCNTHKEKFKVKPIKHIHNGQTCGLCTNSYRYKDTEDWIKRNVSEEILNKYDFSKAVYVNKETPMELICPIHGSFWRFPSAIKSGNINCTKCNKTILEDKIFDFLKKENIDFIYQCKNADLNWLNRFSLDFFLKDYNIAIECQGRQHFESVQAFGGEEEFNKILDRDKRKKALCKEHNIQLIYFLDEKFLKFIDSDDLAFNSVEDLLNFILTQPKISNQENEAIN